MNIQILISDESHVSHASAICDLIEVSAKLRGTGIARRDPKYVEKKIKSSHAVIALSDNTLVGFCYLETWSHGKYVANSGLIVHPDFRKLGLARRIKEKAFDLARDKYPDAKVFGITTSPAVMKINSELGYLPVSFAELTPDKSFWQGCKSCPNFDILQRNDQRLCLCTGMLAPSKNETLSKNKNKNKKNESTK